MKQLAVDRQLLLIVSSSLSRNVEHRYARPPFFSDLRDVEYEQHGNEKAEYGSSLLTNLSRDLKLKFGKGFSKSNIYLMRLFYLKFQIFQSVTGKLSWT